MAKALIVSDSHGMREELEVVKKRHENEVDLMIHCGDSELNADAKELEGFIVVQGNMDFLGKDMPKEAIELLDSTCIYITHGHLYNVKMSHLSLMYRAEETGATIACYGHSHVAETYERDGMILINPGSLRLPRGTVEKTYAILDVCAQHIDVRFYTLEGSLLNELSKRFTT